MSEGLQPEAESPVGRFALVADDDATMRDILNSLLTDIGYTVIKAASGREALALANDQKFSFAIVDLAMPDGNGLQTCAALRKMPTWCDVPIIILTQHSIDEALKVALRAGANGFLCKPVVPAELFWGLENQLQRSINKSKQNLHVDKTANSLSPLHLVTEEALSRSEWTLRHALSASLDLPWDVVLSKHASSAPVGISSQDQKAFIRDEKLKVLSGEGSTLPHVADSDSAADTYRLADVAKFFGPDAMKRLLGQLVVSIQEVLTTLQAGRIEGEPIDLAHWLHNLAGTAGTLGCTSLSASARDLGHNFSPSSQGEEKFINTAQATLNVINTYIAGMSDIAPAPSQASSLNVLVVDDSATIREIAGAFLRTGGHNVTCVEGGEEAVLAVAATEFQLVLMDVRMPGMDGIEAARRIRAIDGPRGRVPMVALTALTSADQIAQCRGAGMDRVLSKPFDAETLLSVCRELVP